ncbi:hypothetical protein SDC9_106641 [bioreactor metagenome]|uniref:Uncharacterized protein n=1 Tax=bioreactor metagenome TaxID=1076179 RepID=A0A645B2Z9_9ZZZZ
MILLNHIGHFRAPQRNQRAFHAFPRAVANVLRLPLANDFEAKFAKDALQKRFRRFSRVQPLAERSNRFTKRLQPVDHVLRTAGQRLGKQSCRRAHVAGVRFLTYAEVHKRGALQTRGIVVRKVDCDLAGNEVAKTDIRFLKAEVAHHGEFSAVADEPADVELALRRWRQLHVPVHHGTLHLKPTVAGADHAARRTVALEDG